MSSPPEVARSQTLGTRGGVGAANFRAAPRPLPLKRHTTRTRTVPTATRELERSSSAPKMLGYDQPGDSQVHGVAQGAFRALDVPKGSATHG